MTSETDADTVLDPTVEMKHEVKSGQLADRFDSLDGKRITLYSNSKKNSDYFLKEVGEELQKRYPDVEISEVQYKPAASSPGSRWGLINEVSQKSDIVLVAYGDCGSCTTYTVYDAIEFEKNGLPTVSFTSDKFIKLAQYDIFYQGCPGLPVVTFEHPIGNLSGSEVKEKRVTDDIIDEVISSLTGSADEIEKRFAERYSIEDFDGKPDYDACTISI